MRNADQNIVNLVTGGNSLIGRVIVEELRKTNAEVTTMVRKTADEIRMKQNGIDAFACNFLATDYLSEQIGQNIRSLFFFLPTDQVVIDRSFEILKVFADAGVQHIIYGSCLSSVFDNDCPCCAKHRENELLIKDLFPYWTIIRPAMFMQCFVNEYSRSIRLFKQIKLPHGDHKVNYVDAIDVGKAVAGIMMSLEKHRSKVYTLTGGRALNNYLIAEFISKATGRCINYYTTDLGKAKADLQRVGISSVAVEHLTALHAVAEKGEAAFTTNDFKEITGVVSNSFKFFADKNVISWK